MKMSRRGACNVRHFPHFASLKISCLRQKGEGFPIIVTLSITNDSKCLRCRWLKVTNTKFIVCDLIRVREGGYRRSPRRTFANVGLGWLTGSRHAISILDLREAWRDKIPSRYRVKSTGASWSWFPQARCNIQLWWRHLILLLYDTSREFAICYQICL